MKNFDVHLLFIPPRLFVYLSSCRRWLTNTCGDSSKQEYISVIVRCTVSLFSIPTSKAKVRLFFIFIYCNLYNFLYSQFQHQIFYLVPITRYKMPICGGISENAEPATSDVHALIQQVKSEVTGKMNASFDVFEAISYKSQVVAGRNYFVKVRNFNKYKIMNNIIIKLLDYFRFTLEMINVFMSAFIKICNRKYLSILLKTTRLGKTQSPTFNRYWFYHNF